ncbi:MFS transporter [Mycolicibacterium sp. ELW1]|uniref:MFS transporter n=1 Tax=Mycobacteriaceae TaxID=1762 RepID=UPI0011ED8CFA|nr:MFS transporter [Mycobacterium sp. ELW1]QEN12838.1 MFS transporter [Mycobacterium sp. ELW1]
MTEATTRAPGRAYRVLLTQGTLYTTGTQLANVSVVLPFICAQEGYYWAAGLLYPAYCIGIVGGNSLSPYILARARHLKHLVIAATTLLMATLVVVSAFSAWTKWFIAGIFLAVSLATGVVGGVSKVAFSEVVSSKLAEQRRSDLILTQGAIGAILAIGTTLVLLPFLAQRDPAHSHLDLLWLGSSGLLAAAIAAVFIGPVRASEVDRVTFKDTYRDGVRAARSQSWFRRYALVQLLFVPVSLGTSFYSIHASVNHSDTAGSLHVLVISSSIGMVAGAVFWRFVSRALGVRGMLINSALLGSAAAAICVVMEYRDDLNHIWIYGIVFILATMANQAIFSAGLAWIGAFAAEDHRATLLGFGSLIIAVESSLLGAALGAVAEGAAVVGPIITILGLNVLAGVAAVWVAPGREGLVRQQ